jgi:hypothetical protein
MAESVLVPPNNELEPTRQIGSRIEDGFGFAGSLPARLLLHTRLAAQHCPLCEIGIFHGL